jgi:hypothetical protein
VGFWFNLLVKILCEFEGEGEVGDRGCVLLLLNCLERRSRRGETHVC